MLIGRAYRNHVLAQRRELTFEQTQALSFEPEKSTRKRSTPNRRDIRNILLFKSKVYRDPPPKRDPRGPRARKRAQVCQTRSAESTS